VRVPDVSVLLPAQNASSTVARALASVQKSRDVFCEIVVVEHASVDETRALVEAAARTDSRIRIVTADHTVGLGGALSRGLDSCRAPIVARMDADDIMHPARLAADVEHLRARPHIDVVSCRVQLFPRRDVGQGMRAYVAWQNSVLDADAHAREIFIEQPLCHPATTFRSAVLRDVGGWRDGPFPEDYDLFLRLAAKGHAMEKRDVVQHAWRVHAKQATRTDPRYARDRHAELKVRALVERFSIDERPVCIAGAGKEGGRIGRALVAERITPTLYFDVAPARIGRVRHGAPVRSSSSMANVKEEFPRAFVIAAVGTSGARGVVRTEIARAGFVEGEDFVVVC